MWREGYMGREGTGLVGGVQMYLMLWTHSGD